MTIETTRETEERVTRIMRTGNFQSVSDVVAQALVTFEEVQSQGSSFRREEGYPPGSLLHLYTPEENEFELRLVRSHAKKLEAF